MELKRIKKVEDIVFPRRFKADDEIHYHFNFPKYDAKDIDEIVRRLVAIKEGLPNKFFVIIDTEHRNFDDLDFGFFIELEVKLKRHGMNVYYNGGYKLNYTLTEFMTADIKLDKFIYHIKNDTLSPFEKYLLIYNYLAPKRYKEEDVRGEDVHKPRDIISIMNSDYIVCEGFANLMTYLCNNVGIFCIGQTLSVNNDNCDRHMNNLVYIDDDKYDIHGLYYSDVTWDSGHTTDWVKQYNFCLLPVVDAYRLTTTIDIEPFYMMFHDPKQAFLRVCDSDIKNLVGFYADDDFYIKSFVEDIFPVEKEVAASYQKAMQLYLGNRKEAIQKLRELCIIKNVPFDAYARSQYVPHGTTLMFLIAVLCYSSDATALVDQCISNLLIHLEKPMNEEGGVLAGEILPSIRVSNMYRALNVLEKMSDEEINKPFEELDELKNHCVGTIENLEMTEDDWLYLERYQLLYFIIEKLRNIIVYNPVQELIKNKYHHGEPIPMEKFAKGLKRVFMFDGMEESRADLLVKESLNFTKGLAEGYYRKDATNCFNTTPEIEMFKSNIASCPLVDHFVIEGNSISITTTIYLRKADQYLELKLVKDSDNWILSDNGHLHKLLEEKYFAVDEGRYTRTAYFTGLKNQNFNLSKKVNYSSLEKGMDGFKTFVTNITKRTAE